MFADLVATSDSFTSKLSICANIVATSYNLTDILCNLTDVAETTANLECFDLKLSPS